MKAAIDRFIRIKMNENSDLMSDIRQRIKEKVELEFNEEVKQLRDENQFFLQQEKVFKEKAYEVVKQAYLNRSGVHVKTQVGRNGNIIQEYTGYVTDLYDASKCFSMSDPTVYDGNPFTIGLSCLLEIEIL